VYHRRRRGDTLAGVIHGKVDETQLKAMLEQINEKTEQKVKVRRANAATFPFVHIYCPGYCCAPHELGRFRRRLIWRVELKADGELAAQQTSLGTESLGDTCLLFPQPHMRGPRPGLRIQVPGGGRRPLPHHFVLRRSVMQLRFQ
jgi:hypothetical protein